MSNILYCGISPGKILSISEIPHDIIRVLSTAGIVNGASVATSSVISAGGLVVNSVGNGVSLAIPSTLYSSVVSSTAVPAGSVVPGGGVVNSVASSIVPVSSSGGVVNSVGVPLPIPAALYSGALVSSTTVPATVVVV